MLVRVVGGEPVVHLERCPGQAAPVHRTDDHFLIEGAEQEQVLEDVRSAEHAVDARSRQCEAEPVEQLGPVGHRQRIRPGPQRAAGWMIGRDHHQLAVLAEQTGGWLAGLSGLGDGAG